MPQFAFKSELGLLNVLLAAQRGSPGHMDDVCVYFYRTGDQ